MDIGNKNTDPFKLTCIACGINSDLTLTAFRNRLGEVTGWIVSCEECQPDLANEYEIDFKRKQ